MNDIVREMDGGMYIILSYLRTWMLLTEIDTMARKLTVDMS